VGGYRPDQMGNGRKIEEGWAPFHTIIGGKRDGSGNSNSRGRLNDNRMGEGLLIYRQATIRVHLV